MASAAAPFCSSGRASSRDLGLALGFTLTYLSLIVLIPLAALIVRSSSLGSAEFLRLTLDGRTVRGAA